MQQQKAKHGQRAPLHGLTTYPCAQNVAEMARLAPGLYELPRVTRPDGGVDGHVSASATHFPLVNVTHPDYGRHPLYRHARSVTVDVREVAAGATGSSSAAAAPCAAPSEIRDAAAVIPTFARVDVVQINCEGCEYEALERLINVTNILYASNPTTAVALLRKK